MCDVQHIVSLCVNCWLATTQPGVLPIIPDLRVCARVQYARNPRQGVYISHPSPVDPSRRAAMQLRADQAADQSLK